MSWISCFNLGELKNIFVNELLKFSLLFLSVTADVFVFVVEDAPVDDVFGEI